MVRLKRGQLIGYLVLAAVLPLSVQACSHEVEVVGTTSEKISAIYPNAFAGQGSESTIAVVRRGTGSVAVAGFNAYGGWAWSDNHGQSWVAHTAKDVGFGWGTPPEESNLPYPWQYDGPFSDPTVVDIGSGNLAYVDIARRYDQSTNQYANSDVIMATSTDGGRHFGAPSCASSSDCPGGSCINFRCSWSADIHLIGSSGGSVDQPIAASDVKPDGTSEVFVVWRDADALFIRDVFVNASGQLGFDPILSVVHNVNNTYNPLAALGRSGSVALAVAPARDGFPQTLYLAFPTTNTQKPSPLCSNSPSCSACGTYASDPNYGISMTWFLQASIDKGMTWQNAGRPPIMVDGKWHWCVPGISNDNVENRNRPQLAWDAIHRRLLFVAIATGYTPSARDVGPRIQYAESADQGQSWPIHYVGSCLGGQMVGQLTEQEPNCSHFNASLAVGNGNAAIAFHSTEDGGGWAYGVPSNVAVDLHGATIVPGVFAPYPHMPLSYGLGTVPWTTPQVLLNTNYAYGDYDSAAVDPTTGDFYVAWGDLRNASTNFGNTEVWVDRITP